MRSPFKFLDAYTLADSDTFFGREAETEALYKMVFQTPLLLLYGLSGTGKTSLIQCGLASKFDGPDWFPIFIRRQDNINEALQKALDAVITEAEERPVSLIDKVSHLYRHYLRPVYLIFDQFEELFILGNREEQQAFIEELRGLLAQRLPCKVLLTMREEYIGQMYDFEKVIPTLFDFRLRLEPMSLLRVQEVMRQSFQKFNILLEPPENVRLEQMLDNLSAGKSGIQLPYLQVYLDRLYRENFQNTYARDREGEELPVLTFTEKEISELGRIENVLEKFLQEQESAIQKQIAEKYPELPPQIVRQVMDAFVTEEGTKRPVHFFWQDGHIQLDEKVQEWLPAMPPAALTELIEALERRRLLRFAGENMELAHDSLADLIDRQRSDQQRQLNDIKRRIQHSYDEFLKSGDFLSRRQLHTFEEYLPQLRLEEDLKAFLEKSRQDVLGKEAAEMERQRRELELTQQKLAAEQRAKRRQRGYLIAVALVALVAFGAGIWAYQKQLEAVEANQNLRAQIIQTTLANVFSARNKGDYQEAINQILAANEIVETTDRNAYAVLDSNLQQIQAVARLAQTADSLARREATLPAALRQYERAHQLSPDGHLAVKIEQTQAEIDRQFEENKDRGISIAKFGGCKFARPYLELAEQLKPGDSLVVAALRRCQLPGQ